MRDCFASQSVRAHSSSQAVDVGACLRVIGAIAVAAEAMALAETETAMTEICSAHKWWLITIFMVAWIATVVWLPIAVVRLPPDYFMRPERCAQRRCQRSANFAILSLKKAIGLILLIAGVVMLLPLVPGPGLLSIFIGLSLLNFRDTRRLQLIMLSRPWLLSRINKLRAMEHRPPLIVPGQLLKSQKQQRR